MQTNHSTPSAAARTGRFLRHDGFTLLELIVVLAILGILATVAVPSFRAAARSMALSSASNAFLSGLHAARSESIKRNGRVAVCKSSDGARCEAAGGWEQGWILFDDSNGNGTREHPEIVLHRMQALPAGMRIVGNQPVSRYVAFSGMGGTRLAGGGFQAGTVTLCHASAERTDARQIVISAVGRPRVHRAQVASCG